MRTAWTNHQVLDITRDDVGHDRDGSGRADSRIRLHLRHSCVIATNQGELLWTELPYPHRFGGVAECILHPDDVRMGSGEHSQILRQGLRTSSSRNQVRYELDAGMSLGDGLVVLLSNLLRTRSVVVGIHQQNGGNAHILDTSRRFHALLCAVASRACNDPASGTRVLIHAFDDIEMLIP